MPVVTAIKPQKSKRRVNVYLDGKFGFGLDLQTFIKENLKVEQVLTDKEIETIVKQGTFQTTYDKILRFATLRPRSKKEIENWLIKYKIHESLKGELFSRLKRLELLDDKKFAAWWIDQRQQFRPKSKRVLNQELRIKGIDQETINQVITEDNVDEKKTAERLITKKINNWRRLPEFEMRKKIFNFLMQRGFNTEIIKDVIEGIVQG